MSLTESCLTAAVIATITMAALPSLVRSRETYVLDAAARQAAGKMHAARIKAVSQSRDCRLRPDSPASYLIECQDSEWIRVERVLLPDGIRITSNAAPEFHRRGNAAPAATVTLYNFRGRQRSVIVNSAGRIRVQ
jgi:Tfp pilus assembly protein FimT